jgi:hypothetical protein
LCAVLLTNQYDTCGNMSCTFGFYFIYIHPPAPSAKFPFFRPA